MCRRATLRFLAAAAVIAAPGWYAWSQSTGLDWRHIGNTAIDMAFPSVATGPVDRVWYSGDGSILFVRTVSGRIFQTTTFEKWQRVLDPKVVPPSRENPPAESMPEARLEGCVAVRGLQQIVWSRPGCLPV